MSLSRMSTASEVDSRAIETIDLGSHEALPYLNTAWKEQANSENVGIDWVIQLEQRLE